METVSEKFQAARARASRALDDVDRSRATRALAVAVAIATLATLNPTPESFHAVCSRGAHAGTSLAEKALPIRATRSWACSNGGFLRAVRLRREAFSVADLFVASIARVRDGSHFFGCLGTWVAVPRALGPIATLAVDVYRVHATVFACAMLACVGMITLRALRAMKMLAMGLAACVVAAAALPRACGAPLGVVVLCAAGLGVAYRMKKLDRLIRFLAAVAPKPRGRRRP